MLPYLRAFLFVAGVAFCASLGTTAENFIIEVLRRFLPIAPENIVPFNALNIAAALITILGIGVLLHIAIGSERGGREALWGVIGAVTLAVCGFRAYQVFWVISSGAAASPGVQPGSPFNLFAYEKLIPSLLIVFLTFPPFLISKTISNLISKLYYLSITLTFIWLLGTGKLQIFMANWEIVVSYFGAIFVAFLILFAGRKMEII